MSQWYDRKIVCMPYFLSCPTNVLVWVVYSSYTNLHLSIIFRSSHGSPHDQLVSNHWKRSYPRYGKDERLSSVNGLINFSETCPFFMSIFLKIIFQEIVVFSLWELRRRNKKCCRWMSRKVDLTWSCQSVGTTTGKKKITCLFIYNMYS